MAIIQPDGLFNGKRLRLCSDQARLLWPYLFLAADGFGRLEIDHEAIFRNFFVDFRKFPKPSEFFVILREYSDNGLLFLYEVDGRIWGQWDCKPGTLSRFKTTKDRQSPEPPAEDLEKWKKVYLLKTKTLTNISEIFGNIPKIFAGEERRGVGVGVGVGEERRGEGESIPDSQQATEIQPPPPAERNGTEPDELFANAATMACEQLPAGGDVQLTTAAIRSEFQKSANYAGNPSGFAKAYCSAVSKWRVAYDSNHDLRPKAAQWWTRDGTYAQKAPKPRKPKEFGPRDLGENLDG